MLQDQIIFLIEREKAMKKFVVLLLTFVMLFSLCAFSAAADEADEGLKHDVVILFTSDVHCGVDQNWGYAGLAAFRDYYGEKCHVLLVDNGDAIQGEPVGTMTTGGAIVDLMNAVEYDSKIMGNHEFDYGMERFMELAKKSKTPYISCNFTHNGELVFEPYTIKEFDGVKIAFVGVTTPETFTSSTPAYFQDEEGNFVYGFCEGNEGQDLYDAVQNAVDAAREEGASYVFLQAHLGIEEACSPWMSTDVITHTTGIDAVLDGHSHSVIDPATTLVIAGEEVSLGAVKNAEGKEVMLMACGTKLNHVGAVTISAADGSISGKLYPWQFDDNAAAVFGLNGYAVKAVDKATKELNKKLSTAVATSEVALTINDPVETKVRLIRNMETNLGDLCADAYRDQGGNVDVAFVNGGGIRVSIPAGKITLNDILKVHPFGNSLTVVEATGQQILDYLEWTSRAVPSESGAFAQVSGLTYEIHTYIESTVTQDEHNMFTGVEGERRVKNVKIGGEDLDPEKVYTVASHDYMLLNNGDGVTAFNGCKVLQKSVKLDNQVLIDYITGTLGGVIGEQYSDPYGEGRIVIVNEAP